jgi:polyisoprenyl-phosphate glycosyltransferase
MTFGSKRTLAVITPVLDDWCAFATLVAEIARGYAGSEITFEIYAVDDGSVETFEPSSITLPADGCIARIEVLHLALNLGHQRAIAAGLCTLAERSDLDAVVVMDSDGEDRPTDIRALLGASHQHPGKVILAARTQRTESRFFKTSYAAYRLLFRLLTGRGISFGNFSLIPIAAVQRLVHMPELWNNLPASIIRSRLSYLAVPTARGNRYAGQSRMGGLVGLVAHGLSAMSVYTDLIFVRVLLAAAFVGVLSILGLIGVILIRLATDLAIPGWATGIAGNLLIILLLTLVVVVATTLMMLAGRSLRPIIPIIDALHFIARRERCDREP